MSVKPEESIKKWYSSHCQGLDVEWKVYILFQNHYQIEPNSITCYKIKIR